jgi:hypothetical protein
MYREALKRLNAAIAFESSDVDLEDAECSSISDFLHLPSFSFRFTF